MKRFTWLREDRRRSPLHYTCVGWIPDNRDGGFSFTAGFTNDAEMRLEAKGAEFFVGDMPGIEGAPPDLTRDDDETIRARLPSWTTPFAPHSAVFLDPEPAVTRQPEVWGSAPSSRENFLARARRVARLGRLGRRRR